MINKRKINTVHMSSVLFAKICQNNFLVRGGLLSGYICGGLRSSYVCRYFITIAKIKLLMWTDTEGYIFRLTKGQSKDT